MRQLIEEKKRAAKELGYEIGATYFDSDWNQKFVVSDAWFDPLQDAVVLLVWDDGVTSEEIFPITPEQRMVKPCYVISD